MDRLQNLTDPLFLQVHASGREEPHPDVILAGRCQPAQPTPGSASPARRLPLFERLVIQAIDTLDVSQLCSPSTVRAGTARISKASHVPDEDYFHPETPLELCAVSALGLTSFFEALIVTKVKDQLLMRLAFKIVNRANYIRRPEFAGLWWPFVRLLADTLPELGIPPTTPRYLNTVMAIVEARLLRDVGEQPPVTWGRTKGQVQCGNLDCALCPQVNEFLGGDAETTSILVPEESNRHMLELVGPTLVAMGCELEPRPPFLVVRKRFYDKDALEAFYARQEAFKQDLLTEKEWLEPVFQADGTSFDQLIARLSCTDPIVTNASGPDGRAGASTVGLPSNAGPFGSPGGIPGPGRGPPGCLFPGGSSSSIDATLTGAVAHGDPSTALSWPVFCAACAARPSSVGHSRVFASSSWTGTLPTGQPLRRPSTELLSSATELIASATKLVSSAAKRLSSATERLSPSTKLIPESPLDAKSPGSSCTFGRRVNLAV